MQTNRERLITQGIWSKDDPRNPETDDGAMRELREWIERQFAPSVKFDLKEGPLPEEERGVNGGTSFFRPYLFIGSGGNSVTQEPIPTGVSLNELDTEGKALCVCALMIRTYLERRPELAYKTNDDE